MLSLLFGKYRGVVLSIALFLLLDASVLTLNFYISYQIADDAIAVNNAGRQRMLSQRMVKSIYDIQYAGDNPAAIDLAAKDLRKTSQLFDETLTAFDVGGTITGADQSRVSLNPVATENGQNILVKAQQLWRPLNASIENLLLKIDRHQPIDAELADAIKHAQLSNLELLSLMNQLTLDLETTATQKALRLRWIQTAGMTLAIINFIIILVHFLGQLRRNDQQLDAARKETSDILNTVNEGLFLLDQDLMISGQHSACLEELFGGQSVAHRSFADLLRELVCEKDMVVAQRFVGLLFRKDVRSNLIGDLNPLDQVEIHIADGSGGFQTRYLSFDFRRVVEQREVIGVLVTVNDITNNILLARELEQTKAHNEQQLTLLSSILHAEPSALKRFIQNAFDSCMHINTILRDQKKGPEALYSKLKDIYIEVHSFKGEASAYQLDQFADIAHEFEQSIEELTGKSDLNGNDLLRLTVKLEKLLKQLEALQDLADKLAGFAQVSSHSAHQSAVQDASSRWTHLYDLTSSIAEREGKQAYLVMSGFAEADLEPGISTLVNDLSVQFIRNAVVHGLELPNVRKSQKKPPAGRIDLRLARLPDGQMELSICDDGRGLDYNLIRRKALATGRWSSEEIASWSHKRLLMLIFESGFSTSARTNEDAGRGMGMDVIAKRIRQLNGNIRVSSRTGKQCLFTVTLPLEKTQSHADAA